MRIKKVDYIKDFKLKIKFNDNKIKIVDFWPLIKESTSVYIIPLRDIEFFKKVSVDPDLITVVWPNEADFDPSLLYRVGKSIPEKQSKTKAPVNRRKVVSGKAAAYAIKKKRSPKK